MPREWKVLAIAKRSGQRYVFLFDGDQSRKALLNQFGKFAADPELDFNWHDAAILVKKLRHTFR